ncbi:MAG: F0F1 ATP synthase subunit B [Bacteroidia bacterium]|jgi:F-type H+-transporting ATPase subunit b|nr:F0F1 ATP synthase subunit B [Bacteroidia bacterium]
MELLTPSLGLLFWMSLAFIIVLVLLKKFAWSGILKALKDREDFIELSLKSAEDAKAQMSELKADNEKLLAEARLEREQILKEAKEMKDNILVEAKLTASEEGNRLIAAARSEIEKEKNQALSDIKKQVGEISLEIAERVIRKELSDKGAQEALVAEHLSKAQSN